VALERIRWHHQRSLYSEDVHTGFSVLSAGWQVVYIPICLAMGMCLSQCVLRLKQYRWAMGSTAAEPWFWHSPGASRARVPSQQRDVLLRDCDGHLPEPSPGFTLLIWVLPSAVMWFNVLRRAQHPAVDDRDAAVGGNSRYDYAARRVKGDQNCLWGDQDKLT
jgi:hypothetical protein